jgi:glutamate-1-semialdehyde 2,1-aminomutase
VMEAAQSTFISSTNWTERIGPTAALATIRKIQRDHVVEHINRIGTQINEGWQRIGEANGFRIHTAELPSLTHFSIDHPDELLLSTLFTQEMLERGYLAGKMFKPSFAHSPAHVERYLQAAAETFSTMKDATARGELQSRLKGPAQRRGFYRLTS